MIFTIRDGKHTLIYRGDKVSKVAATFGRSREKKLLKIFIDEPIKGNPEKKQWGDDKVGLPLEDATKIQNYMWREGLAPRVYGILMVNLCGKQYAAQLVEDIGDNFDTENFLEVYDKVTKLGEKYGFTITKRDASHYDVIDGKLVDFNTFKFTRDHKKKIAEMVHELGKWGKTHYQSVPELGLGKFRDTEKRIGWMALDTIEFSGKTVLDIGCSSGVFCNYASEKGAKRVIGTDTHNNCKAAHILSTYLGHFNNDYIEKDLRSEEFVGDFDIVFFLSMLYHIGYPKWIPAITKELMICEWNNLQKGMEGRNVTQEESEKQILGLLERDFKSVKMVGRGEDHGGKAIWHCEK